MRSSQGTNQQLYNYNKEIEAMAGSVLFQFNKGKISDFFKHNGVRLASMLEARNDLLKKYFVLENSNVKMEGEGKDAKPVLLEGKTMEDYNADITALMNKEIPIVI